MRSSPRHGRRPVAAGDFSSAAFAVKLVFGEMGEDLLLGSQKVEASKLISTGYPFRYRELRTSLESLLRS